MRTRAQLIKEVCEMTDFTVHELVININIIREMLPEILGHLKDATKIAADNKKKQVHIKQLKARIQQLEARVPRWIPVEERLP